MLLWSLVMFAFNDKLGLRSTDAQEVPVGNHLKTRVLILLGSSEFFTRFRMMLESDDSSYIIHNNIINHGVGVYGLPLQHMLLVLQ